MNELPSFEKMSSSFGLANEKIAHFLQRHTTTLIVPRGKLLIVPGSVCNKLYLVQQGIFRGFIKEAEKEITTWITAEGELITAIRSFILQMPTEEQVQAIEDCKVSVISYDDVQYLYSHFMKLNIAGRKLMEIYYSHAEERAYIIRLSNAGLKYKYFLKTKGHLINRIPLKVIASYLGMTIETLSRTRRRISHKNEI